MYVIALPTNKTCTRNKKILGEEKERELIPKDEKRTKTSKKKDGSKNSYYSHKSWFSFTPINLSFNRFVVGGGGGGCLLFGVKDEFRILYKEI